MDKVVNEVCYLEKRHCAINLLTFRTHLKAIILQGVRLLNKIRRKSYYLICIVWHQFRGLRYVLCVPHKSDRLDPTVRDVSNLRIGVKCTICYSNA